MRELTTSEWRAFNAALEMALDSLWAGINASSFLEGAGVPREELGPHPRIVLTRDEWYRLAAALGIVDDSS